MTLMDRPRLLPNILTLGGLRIANFVVALATLPYLTRALGVTSWGEIVFAQTIVNYLVWVSNWGFYQNAVRKIAAGRNDIVLVRRVFMCTWVAQWGLTLVVSLLLLVAMYTVPVLASSRPLYWAGFGAIVANLLTPNWFLNGMEHIREVALIQILTKLLAIPAIFWLVHSPGDSFTYVAINSVCAIGVGAIALCWIRRRFQLRWFMPPVREVVFELREGVVLFASSIWANLYGNLTPTALGLIAGPTALGYYNLADRVRGAAITLLHPITHALFPRMCSLFAMNQTEARRLLIRSGLLIGCGSFGIALGVSVFADKALALLGGDGFRDAIPVLRWLAFSIFVTTLSEFCIYQILVPAGRFRVFHGAIATTLALAVIAVYPAMMHFGLEGAAIFTVCAETFLTATLLSILVWKRFYLSPNLSNT